MMNKKLFLGAVLLSQLAYGMNELSMSKAQIQGKEILLKCLSESTAVYLKNVLNGRFMDQQADVSTTHQEKTSFKHCEQGNCSNTLTTILKIERSSKDSVKLIVEIIKSQQACPCVNDDSDFLEN